MLIPVVPGAWCDRRLGADGPLGMWRKRAIGEHRVSRVEWSPVPVFPERGASSNYLRDPGTTRSSIMLPDSHRFRDPGVRGLVYDSAGISCARRDGDPRLALSHNRECGFAG